MGAPAQPPMAWKYCGDQIKRWRAQAGVTREQLSRAANYDIESVRSMEAGRRKPSLKLLETADELCDARGLLVGAQEYLKPEKFPTYSQGYTDAEARAIAINWYEGLLIPGLLQTEQYARELLSHSCPPLDDETVDARVAARLERQEKLQNSPTVMFGFVIYEAAFRSMVGGPDCMRPQLHHLIEAGQLRNVTVQVLPIGRGAYTGLGGSLILLESPEHEHFAYIEGQETGVLYADSNKVSVLTRRHGMICSQALGVEDSAAFIEQVAEEL
ncbi:helix-turn-helix domain-containing protein [Kitasatospora sp. NPDC094019]|uniref:helix-turn-helix domain-containing protein n=1 Tax=Kitasatospora sp. NPDC094019 TaxID=3364091 RepID=UPI00381D0899